VDDMAKIIKELCNKISKMELDQTKNDHFPRKNFRRNPNPQAPQRKIKNDYQKIPNPSRVKTSLERKT
jgi:hypothetical protein